MNKILNNKPKYINKSIPKFNYIKNNFNIFNKKSDNLLNNNKLNKFNYLYNKKYYHISTNNLKQDYYDPYKYKYNFLFGGLCGIFLVDIYDEYLNKEYLLDQIYINNIFMDITRIPLNMYIIGFMIGGLIYPLSYSLSSAYIFFYYMKKLL